MFKPWKRPLIPQWGKSSQRDDVGQTHQTPVWVLGLHTGFSLCRRFSGALSGQARLREAGVCTCMPRGQEAGVSAVLSHAQQTLSTVTSWAFEICGASSCSSASLLIVPPALSGNALLFERGIPGAFPGPRSMSAVTGVSQRQTSAVSSAWLPQGQVSFLAIAVLVEAS